MIPPLLQGDHPQLMAQRPGSIHPHLMAFPALCPDLAFAQFASVWIFPPHLLTFLSCMPPKPKDKSPFCSLPLTQECSPHLPAHPLGIFHWNNCALQAVISGLLHPVPGISLNLQSKLEEKDDQKEKCKLKLHASVHLREKLFQTPAVAQD